MRQHLSLLSTDSKYQREKERERGGREGEAEREEREGRRDRKGEIERR